MRRVQMKDEETMATSFSRKERKMMLRKPPTDFSSFYIFKVMLYFFAFMVLIYALVSFLNHHDGQQELVVHNHLDRSISISFYTGLHPDRVVEFGGIRYRKPAVIQPGHRHILRRPMEHKSQHNEHKAIVVAYSSPLLKPTLMFHELYALNQGYDDVYNASHIFAFDFTGQDSPHAFLMLDSQGKLILHIPSPEEMLSDDKKNEVLEPEDPVESEQA